MVKLDHPLIKEDGEAPDMLLDNAVLDKLKQYRAMNKFKKVALRVIIQNRTKENTRDQIFSFSFSFHLHIEH